MVKFMAVVMALFAVLAIAAVIGGIVALVVGAWLMGLIILIVAGVFYLMSRSISRSISDLRA